ncbi:VOC family protein [Cupriavidus numazuensis]|uniref:VOC domain-containing protein n=1 Tax=Cupriavidus numazuensis TaxID=221992 RepID=A0ABN7QB18_9BURK|nr:VOC family protein [Cupriavidus numazuensis]CAG2160749.1 hypothetical protein LMG26411_07723 [Cupriavidus numazuensis]
MVNRYQKGHPTIGRLLEIGVVVSDLGGALERLEHVFEGAASPIISDPNFQMEFRMCRVIDTDFEIMRSKDSRDLIGRYIERFGEGLHHVAFQVEDAKKAMEEFRAMGVPPLSDELIKLDNLRAFFLPPRIFGGVLFEFIENLHHWIDGMPLVPPGETKPLTNGGVRIRGFGVRVNDLASVMKAFREVLGADNSDIFVDSELQVRACISRLANTEFKLMEKILPSADSKIPIVENRALQYVRIEARDVIAAIARMKGGGVRFLKDGDLAEGTSLSRFSDPKSCNGIMFEILEL